METWWPLSSFQNLQPSICPSPSSTPSTRGGGSGGWRHEVRRCQAKALTHSEAGSISILPLLSPYQTSPCLLLGLAGDKSSEGGGKRKGKSKEDEEKTNDVTGGAEQWDGL